MSQQSQTCYAGVRYQISLLKVICVGDSNNNNESMLTSPDLNSLAFQLQLLHVLMTSLFFGFMEEHLGWEPNFSDDSTSILQIF
jgi:hypothetical protein